MENNWQKSSFSTDSEGNCLEVAPRGDEVLLRESDNPDVIVTTTRAKLAAFLAGAKAGEFDNLV
ncbi:DUF397 domain-containing protein [Streptomyces zinciresistens]|uniref:DUF397 domain-containing protein n=1 Tax=Streptomyces zinciresistens TaxID=1073330 RepID=UPI00031C60F3|nr:DUF397 domain-containing protein [Streptomyces zinciresistens]